MYNVHCTLTPTSRDAGRLQMVCMWLYALSRDMKEEKKYFSSFVEIEIALLITSAVFSFFIDVILHTSIVNCREGMLQFF